MLKKLFTLIAAFAMTLGMVISAPVVHAEEIIYPTGISGSSKGMRRILLELGVPYDLDKYVQSIVLPEGATVNENTVVYSLADDEENVLVLNDNRTATVIMITGDLTRPIIQFSDGTFLNLNDNPSLYITAIL